MVYQLVLMDSAKKFVCLLTGQAPYRRTNGRTDRKALSIAEPTALRSLKSKSGVVFLYSDTGSQL